MPRKPKLCVEEKVDIVRRCLKESKEYVKQAERQE